MKNNTVEEIVKKLRNVSDMINMGEKIQWGQETALMDEAADLLESLTQHHQDQLREVVAEIKQRLIITVHPSEVCDFVCGEIDDIAQTRGIDISDKN